MACKVVSYCNGWSPITGKPFVPWSEDKAERAHRSSSHKYGFLVDCEHAYGDRVAVNLSVSSERGGAEVFFLGEGRFNYATYFFSSDRCEEGLFLDSAIFMKPTTSPKDCRDHAWRLTHRFQADGSVKTVYFRHGIRAKNKIVEWKAEVLSHYEEVPVFGSYEDLSRLDRGQGWTVDDAHGLER